MHELYVISYGKRSLHIVISYGTKSLHIECINNRNIRINVPGIQMLCIITIKHYDVDAPVLDHNFNV